MKALDSRHVVVIGGTSGMGLATARAAAAAGARLTIAGRDEGRLSRAAATVGPGTATRRPTSIINTLNVMGMPRRRTRTSSRYELRGSA